MSRKRTLISDVFKQKKKLCADKTEKTNGYTDDKADDDEEGETNDVKAAMTSLTTLFPLDKFDNRLPPIVLKHQLYSLIKNREDVDQQVRQHQEQGEIKIFQHNTGDTTQELLVFTSDYRGHVQCVLTEMGLNKELTDKFLSTIVNKCTTECVDRHLLTKIYGFTESDINQLVKVGVLNVKDTGSWWVALPNVPLFMKSFIRGRKAVITMIKKCKYREVLRQDLEHRKWPKIAKLGLMYHINDVIGAELVECLDTNSGDLLRYKD